MAEKFRLQLILILRGLASKENLVALCWLPFGLPSNNVIFIN